MKQSTCILFCFLALSIGAANAQYNNAGRSSLGISLGWQEMKFNDGLASPLLYKASKVPFVGLNYTNSNPRHYFKARLSGGIGSANPERFGPRDYVTKWSDKDSFQYQISSMFASANLEVTYLRKLNPMSKGAFGYWLGGTINDQAYYADEVANFPWLINTAEFSPSFKMGLQNSARHIFSIKIDLAGIALLSRSAYALFPKSNRDKNAYAFFKQGTRLTSVHQYQKVNVELDYGYLVSQRITLGGTYALKWLHYSHPKSLRLTDNRFNINIDYALHK